MQLLPHFSEAPVKQTKELEKKIRRLFFSPFISILWKPLWSYNFTLFWISCTFSHSAAALPFHLGQEFSFSACGWMCSGLKGCAGKRCLQLQVWSWDLRGVVAAGSPGNTSGSWCIPAGVAAVNCGCHSWGGAAWWQQGSWSFQRRVMEEDEWAGIGGALHIISKVVLISCAMHCSNTCQALNFDISELLFATVLLWPEAVLIVSLQLTCQGQTLLIAFHVFFHKEFMETQALKNTSERTFRWSAKVMLECLLEGTSALTSQFRSSGIWSRWTKSEKMKPPKENSCSRICAGWPTPVCCPGGKGQEELQGRVWVHWPSYAGNLDSLIPLPDSCQEQFNARTLNLPTLCMYLLDLINGQTHLSPLVEKAWTMHV